MCHLARCKKNRPEQENENVSDKNESYSVAIFFGEGGDFPITCFLSFVDSLLVKLKSTFKRQL